MASTPQLSKKGFTPLLANVPEFTLVQWAKSGDCPAFEELVRRTNDVCFRIATSMLGDREEARDEVQNAFWLAYSRIELFTYQSKFSTWLVRIVINRCFMHLRSKQRTPIFADHALGEDGGWCPSEGVTHDTPEVHFGRQEVSAALRQELRSIPTLLRTPIELHYIDELPVKEVARELGLTLAAAKSRLHRGHLYLRDRMLKHAPRRGPASLTADIRTRLLPARVQNGGAKKI